MTHHPHRQPADKLWLEAELDKILGLRVVEDIVNRLRRSFLCGKSDAGLAQTAANDFFQTVKCTADNEEDVLGINRGGRFSAALGEIHHGLNLAGDIVLG